jgi:osmotically-inducible protein OsmY
MSDANRWSEDRSDRDQTRGGGRYGRDYDDNQRRYAADRDAYYGFNQDDQYGDNFYGRSYIYGRFGGRGENRSLSYGGDRYGIASDYNFRGSQRDNERNVRMGGYGEDRYGSGYSDSQNRYDQSRLTERDAYGQSIRDRGFGTDRYHLSEDRRPNEERSWWNQTRDEVSSWFGDDEAMRPRPMDVLRAGEHRGRGPKGYTRSDERIREDVNDRFTDHPLLNASDIEVSVSNGEVTLSGKVHRREDKRRAEDSAERVSGVKHVQNNLRMHELSAADRTGSFGSATIGSTANQTSSAGQTKTN